MIAIWTHISDLLEVDNRELFVRKYKNYLLSQDSK